jgi:hypothetical protein
MQETKRKKEEQKKKTQIQEQSIIAFRYANMMQSKRQNKVLSSNL